MDVGENKEEEQTEGYKEMGKGRPTKRDRVPTGVGPAGDHPEMPMPDGQLPLRPKVCV